MPTIPFPAVLAHEMACEVLSAGCRGRCCMRSPFDDGMNMEGDSYPTMDSSVLAELPIDAGKRWERSLDDSE